MFNTETKRTNYFVDKWGVVEPVEIVLGMRYDMRRNKKTGCYDQVPVKETCVCPIFGNIKIYVSKCRCMYTADRIYWKAEITY